MVSGPSLACHMTDSILLAVQRLYLEGKRTDEDLEAVVACPFAILEAAVEDRTWCLVHPEEEGDQGGSAVAVGSP